MARTTRGVLMFALSGAFGCGGRESGINTGTSSGRDASAATAPGSDLGSGVDTSVGPDASPGSPNASTDRTECTPSDGGAPDACEGAIPYDSGIDPIDSLSPAPSPGLAIDASSSFDWIEQAFVGNWTGTRTDPWDPAARVLIHFDATKTYTAHCAVLDPMCSVWHYGTDEDLPNKTYNLFDLHANGTGEAYIQIAFSASEAIEGTLDLIAINADTTTLAFDFYPTWAAPTLGPVHFDLQRAP